MPPVAAVVEGSEPKAQRGARASSEERTYGRDMREVCCAAAANRSNRRQQGTSDTTGAPVAGIFATRSWQSSPRIPLSPPPYPAASLPRYSGPHQGPFYPRPPYPGVVVPSHPRVSLTPGQSHFAPQSVAAAFRRVLVILAVCALQPFFLTSFFRSRIIPCAFSDTGYRSSATSHPQKLYHGMSVLEGLQVHEFDARLPCALRDLRFLRNADQAIHSLKATKLEFISAMRALLP